MNYFTNEYIFLQNYWNDCIIYYTIKLNKVGIIKYVILYLMVILKYKYLGSDYINLLAN